VLNEVTSCAQVFVWTGIVEDCERDCNSVRASTEQCHVRRRSPTICQRVLCCGIVLGDLRDKQPPWIAIALWLKRSFACYRCSDVRTAIVLLKSVADFLCPTIFFYHFMYYTDTGGTFFVMLSYYFALRRAPSTSAAVRWSGCRAVSDVCFTVFDDGSDV
jgi:hypothetical protein